MSVPVDAFVDLLLSQDGDRYIFGHEVRHSDSDPDAFDCSELIEWACARLGVTPRMPDGSWYQARHVRAHGLLIPVDQAIRTRGALLFRFSSSPFTGGRPASAHVAVSLGNGQTIEARSTRHGVGRFSAHGRGWTHAGLVPGLDYERKKPMPQPLTDYEKKAIARLEREGIFTKYTTDEPGEVDRPVTVRTLAVILDRLLDAIPRHAGGGKATRDQIIRTIVDALQD